MNNRSRRILYVVGGIYLIYLSFTLISQQIKEATSNAPIAIACGILFFVFGAYLIVDYVKKSVSDYKEQERLNEMEAAKEETEAEEVTEEVTEEVIEEVIEEKEEE